MIHSAASYNEADQLTRAYGSGCTSGTCPSFSYSYTNPATNAQTALVYSVTDALNQTTGYAYDTSNQLTQAVQQSSGGSTLNSWAYAYDSAGNLTSKTVNNAVTTFTYNAANELTQASGAMSKTYTYDANGDLTGISDGTQISINAAGQITNITPPGGSAIAMTYTGVGEQARTGNGSTTSQYDATGIGQQTTSGTTTNFTSLPDGGLISETVGGSTYYYLSDGAGSVAALTNGSGAVVNQYSYDPMGAIISSTVTVSNPFTFQGGQYDGQTGFYYTGSGYYDPKTGQAFGCQDQGSRDPGEDLCGEDEDPSCGGVCDFSGSSGTFTSNSIVLPDPNKLRCYGTATAYGKSQGDNYTLENFGLKGFHCDETVFNVNAQARWQVKEGGKWTTINVARGAEHGCKKDTLYLGGQLVCGLFFELPRPVAPGNYRVYAAVEVKTAGGKYRFFKFQKEYFIP